MPRAVVTAAKRARRRMTPEEKDQEDLRQTCKTIALSLCHIFTPLHAEELVRFLYLRSQDDQYLPSPVLFSLWRLLVTYTEDYAAVCDCVSGGAKKIIHFRPWEACLPEAVASERYNATRAKYREVFDVFLSEEGFWPL
jgi:hypothetical protein